MKILWLCNIVLPDIGSAIGCTGAVTGGWLTGVLDELKKDKNYDITVCFPLDNREELKKTVDRVKYYSFARGNILKYNKQNELFFYKALTSEKPEIIHVWGTEFPHALAMVNACEQANLLNRLVINIQGLISMYGNTTEHYFAGLPESVTKKNTIRDFLKKDNIWEQREKFSVRGQYEILALQKAKHVIGRTEWDRECVRRINSSIQYHFCDENLRSSFYNGAWSYDKCEKHSIFVSQCNYALKGFHRVLAVLPKIIEKYPDANLYTTGENLLKTDGFIKEQRRTYYQLYIRKLIRSYGLEKHVIFCGTLNADQMKERMLKTNVFVSPSAIENSSNSLGEAMLLGVPCISSQVGGIRSMMTHGIDGFLYPFDETYLMENYIDKIFGHPEIAEELSTHAKKTASERHNVKKNTNVLKGIYQRVLVS